MVQEESGVVEVKDPEKVIGVLVKNEAIIPVTNEFDLFWRRSQLKWFYMKDKGLSSDEAERRCVEEIPA